ncbi:hypothetical protein FRC17_000721 [Serendipita sp. 399]|nr:hypothetical protein FRC17_000721 [Serendipita sp. 399]
MDRQSDKLATTSAKIQLLSKELIVLTEPFLVSCRAQTASLRSELYRLNSDANVISTLYSGEKDGIIPHQTDGKAVSVLQELEDILNLALTTLESYRITLQTRLNPVEHTGTLPGSTRRLDSPETNSLSENLHATEQIVAHIRRSLLHLFKGLWYRRSETRLYDISDEMVQAAKDQLQLLQASLLARPFGPWSNTVEIPFISRPPKNRSEQLHEQQYSSAVTQAGRDWARSLLMKTPLNVAYSHFVQLLWSGSVELWRLAHPIMWSHFGALGDSFKQSHALVDDFLRNSIIRSHSSLYTIVLVGLESSGKSAVLNMLIGTDIIPSSEGPTTAMPLRVQHVPGLVEGTLEFNAEYLMRGVDRIREQSWSSKIEYIKSLQWDRLELPGNFPVEELRSRWSKFPSSVLIGALERVSSPTFGVYSPVRGKDAIRQTLSDINSIVRLCRILPVGYDHFDPGDWPHLSIEFESLTSEPIRSTYQFIDIPGVGDARDPHKWDGLTREVLKTANMIIALVPMDDFASSLWREIPSMIMKEAGVRVGTVLLTRLDMAPRSDLPKLCEEVRKVFWPGPASQPGKIIACSPRFARTAQLLHEFISSMDTKPPYDEIFGSTFAPAASKVLPGDPDLYEQRPLGRLQVLAKSGAEWMGYNSVVDAVKGVMHDDGRAWSLLEEGLALHIHLTEMTKALQPAFASLDPSDTNVEIDQHRQREALQEVTKLVETWQKQTSKIYAQVKELIEETSVAFTEGTEESVKTAISQAEQAMDGAKKLSPTLNVASSGIREFTSEASLDKYIRACEACLRQVTQLLENDRLDALVKDVRQARLFQFRDLYGKIADISPQLELELMQHFNENFATSVLNSSPLELPPASHFISKTRRTYSVSSAFQEAKKSVLSSMLSGQDVEQQLKELKQFSHILLNIATAIPFLLGLPLWLRKTYILSYEVVLSVLQTRIVEITQERSRQLISRLDASFLEKEENTSKMLVSSLEVFTKQLEETSSNASLEPVQVLIYAHANVLAAMAATEEFSAAFSNSFTSGQ